MTDWYDRIGQAQQEETDTLSTGHWDSHRPKARWSDVMDMSLDAIQTASKDLQLVVWYVRASCKQTGFTELATAIEGMAEWFDHWWNDGFPACDPMGLDDHPDEANQERMAKLTWLDKHLSHALGTYPLISDDHGTIHWFAWCKAVGDESNKARAERFVHQHRSAIQQQLDDLCRADQALLRVATRIDQRWGQGACPFTRCSELFTRLICKHQDWLGYPQAEPPSGNIAPVATLMTHAGADRQRVSESTQVTAATMNITPAATHRANMIQLLEQVASYFKTHEPYGPLAPMLDKALSWANKPVHVWLSELVHDDQTKQKMQDVLGIRLD